MIDFPVPLKKEERREEIVLTFSQKYTSGILSLKRGIDSAAFLKSKLLATLCVRYLKYSNVDEKTCLFIQMLYTHTGKRELERDIVNKEIANGSILWLAPT